MPINPGWIPYPKQAGLEDIMTRALGLEDTWSEELFEKISVETLIESFLGNYVHDEEEAGLLKYVDF